MFYCSNVFSPKCEKQCEICAGVDAARHDALSAYWDAHNHDEEHRAFQRMIALGCASAEDTEQACQAPECVALREEERRKALGKLGLPIARNFKITNSGRRKAGLASAGLAGLGKFIYLYGRVVAVEQDISAITRDLARKP